MVVSDRSYFSSNNNKPSADFPLNNTPSQTILNEFSEWFAIIQIHDYTYKANY